MVGRRHRDAAGEFAITDAESHLLACGLELGETRPEGAGATANRVPAM